MKPTIFHNPTDLPQASATDQPSDHFLEGYCPGCNHEVDAVCPRCQTHVEATGETDGRGGTEIYRRILLMIASARNAKFIIGCFLIATGDGFANGLSMTEYARRFGVKKATVSKHCRLICETLEITPSSYMQREETAAKFRLTNRRPMKL